LTTEEPKNNSGLWLSIAEIARRKGVSRQAIAERVARFEEAGSITTKPGKAGAKLVNLAEFDRVADEQTSFSKQAGARAGRNDTRSRRGALNDAITEKAQYDAELKRIELAERCGKLVPVDDFMSVVEKCAEVQIAIIESLNRRAEEITAAALAGQVRPLLRSIVFDQRTRIAAAFAAMGNDLAPREAASAAPMVQTKLALPGEDRKG